MAIRDAGGETVDGEMTDMSRDAANRQDGGDKKYMRMVFKAEDKDRKRDA